MYFCPKCNFILDITKRISSDSKNEIASVDEFITRSLDNELDSLVKLKFSKSDLTKSSSYKDLSDENKETIMSKYNTYTNDKFTSAYFICNNCNYNTKLTPGTIIFNTSVSNNVVEDEVVLKSRVLDKTLPRTKDFICPNKSCGTNKNFGSKDREAVFYRPDQNSYNLIYVCCTCKTSWTPYFKTVSK